MKGARDTVAFIADDGDKMTVDVTETAAERARQREIVAYLKATGFARDQRDATIFGKENDCSPSEDINISHDINLSALVQLAAFRTGYERSFLSLIDGKHQYVLAEATRSHSISENNKFVDENDRLYCGVRTIDISWGVCPKTIKYFTGTAEEPSLDTGNVFADKTCYFIRNMAQDPQFASCPYVSGFPYMRSYVEVPLITPLGYCIGSLCVVDKRDPVAQPAQTVAILQEICPAIMKHLDLIRTLGNRVRSEQLVEGLGSFLERDGSRPTHDEYRDDDGTSRKSETAARTAESLSGMSIPRSEAKQGREREQQAALKASTSVPNFSPVQRTPSGSREQFENQSVTDPSMPSPSAFARTKSNTTFATAFTQSTSNTSAMEIDPTTQLRKQLLDGVAVSAASDTNPTRHSLVSADVKTVFQRAAELIRGAMNLDGISFVDACPTSFASGSEVATPQETHQDPFDGEIGPDGRQGFVMADPHAPTPIITRAVRDPIRFAQAIRTPDSSYLTELQLQRLIKKYPRGHIFSADEYGLIDERFRPGKRVSSKTSTMQNSNSQAPKSQITAYVENLFKLLRNARYLAFLPLWHFQRETWYSAIFCWVSDVDQGFESNDLTYLSAFGHSLMAEVSRIEALAISRAKSDFISSISHELRSPLHGILASAELLKEAITEKEHRPMVSMIESCGTTLLDTMEHLLDFAKINHLSNTAGRVLQNGRDSSRKDVKASPKTVTDFKIMIQDVTEAVCIGHASKVAFTANLQSDDQLATSATQQPFEHPVLVTLDIEKLPSWEMNVQVGAWKRIVMNLFGNALKYTRTGTIEVSLKMRQVPDLTGLVRPHICFAVKDTGIGMSAEYQRYFLFQPFAQENILAPGTGLGLSIVKQIVGSMDGRLDVQSAIGVGTQITAYIPAEFGRLPHSTTVDETSAFDIEKLQGKTIRILRAEEYPGHNEKTVDMQDADVNHIKDIQKAFENLANTWLQMQVLPADGTPSLQMSAPSPATAPVDFHVVDKAVLGSEHVDAALENIGARGEKALLICFDPPQMVGKLRGGAVRAWHPLGPNKIAKALNEALATWDQYKSAEFIRGTSPKRRCIDDPALISETARMRRTSSTADGGSAAFITPIETPLTTPSPGIASNPSASRLNLTATSDNPRDPKKPHLLLVEDNPINLKLLSTLATRLKCTYSCATNGLEAINVFKAEVVSAIAPLQAQARIAPTGSPPTATVSPYDLIIMDISMPILNGYGASRGIRSFECEITAMHPHIKLKPTKIVALTGLGNDNDRREAFSSGMQVFLTKPAKLAEVRRLLEEVQAERDQQEQEEAMIAAATVPTAVVGSNDQEMAGMEPMVLGSPKLGSGIPHVPLAFAQFAAPSTFSPTTELTERAAMLTTESVFSGMPSPLSSAKRKRSKDISAQLP